MWSERGISTEVPCWYRAAVRRTIPADTMRSHSAPITSTGAVTAAKSTTAGLRKLWHRKEQLPEIAAGFADQTVIYLPGDVLGLRVSDPASKLLERRESATAWSRNVAVTSAAGTSARLCGSHRGCPPPGRGMLPLSPRGVCARRPTAPAARPSSDLSEAVANPANSRMPPSRRCSPEGLVRRLSSRPRAREVRDGAASGCAPCIRALRMRRGPQPTAPHGPRSRG